MGIRQLSVNHDEQQDRLLLRINTQSGEEYRFWLTRRLAQRLLPPLENTAIEQENRQPGVVATDEAGRKIVAELRRDAFVQKADFQTPFSPEPKALPMGEAPLLVTDVQLTLMAQGEVRILLQDKTGATPRQCQLQLPANLVHALLHLTQQAVQKAEWNLGGHAIGAGPTGPSPDAATGYAH